MSSYIARRRRWFTRLKYLDEGTTVSDNILADYLLDCAGLTEEQILMVRTATQNKSVSADIAEFLRRQHNELHLKESRTSPPQDRQAFRGFRHQNRPPWKATNIRHPPKHRNFEPRAHMADGDEE